MSGVEKDGVRVSRATVFGSLGTTGGLGAGALMVFLLQGRADDDAAAKKALAEEAARLSERAEVALEGRVDSNEASVKKIAESVSELAAKVKVTDTRFAAIEKSLSEIATAAREKTFDRYTAKEAAVDRDRFTAEITALRSELDSRTKIFRSHAERITRLESKLP